MPVNNRLSVYYATHKKKFPKFALNEMFEDQEGFSRRELSIQPCFSKLRSFVYILTKANLGLNVLGKVPLNRAVCTVRFYKKREK